jgi:hypothetical protein
MNSSHRCDLLFQYVEVQLLELFGVLFLDYNLNFSES